MEEINKGRPGKRGKKEKSRRVERASVEGEERQEKKETETETGLRRLVTTVVRDTKAEKEK